MNDRENTSLEIAALSLVTLAITLIGLYMTYAVLVPLVLAILIAVLVDPVLTRLERVGFPRFLSVIVVLTLVTVVALALIVICALAVSRVMADGQAYVDRAQQLYPQVASWSQSTLGVDPREFFQGSSLGDPRAWLTRLSGWAGTANSFLTGWLFSVLYLVVLLSRRDQFANDVRYIVSQQAGDEGLNVLDELEAQIRGYLWLKLLISVPTGLIFGGVAHAFGLDFALAWGLLAFALNFIPSIGPMVATVPAVIVAFLQFDPVVAVIASSVLAAIQTASGNVVEPIVMGEKLRLNFIAVILSIFLWGMLWRVPGLILGVPLTACLNILLSRSRHFQGIARLISR